MNDSPSVGNMGSLVGMNAKKKKLKLQINNGKHHLLTVQYSFDTHPGMFMRLDNKSRELRGTKAGSYLTRNVF